MMTSRSALALSGILFTSALSHAQALPPETGAKIDKLFDQWNRPDSPGCALGVYQNGQIIYEHGYGMSNLNDDVTITPSTVFHVASMSKQFTAASIILLAQQGKLSLDDDIHKYIPELPDFGERITLRHLMHHTSGLRDQWALLGLAGWRYSQDLITDDDVMSVMVHQKALNFKPGEKFLYSNTGFTLLALVVKRVSGVSLREYTTKNIFEPLGMKNTHFRDDHEEVIKHDALGYEQDGEGKPYRMSLTNFDTTGATSLHTTVQDLLLWDENFYNPRVGGPEFVKQMLEPGILNSGKKQDYASGLSIGTYKGLPTVGHGGADAGYRSDMVRFPQQHFTATALCNRADANPGALTRQVAEIVLAKDIKEPTPSPAAATTPKPTGPVALTAEQMKAVAGTYWKKDDNDYQRIVLKDNTLQLDFGGDEYHPLKPLAESHFRVDGVPWSEHMDLHFVAASGTKPAKLEQSWDGGKPDTYEWVQAVDPTPAQLAEYGGAYVSDEIDPVYRFEVRDGKLALLRMKHKPDLLRPTVQDVFAGQIGTLRFTRDSAHRVTGFVLDAGRIQGFQFKRQAGT
ncbi:serine hydrolase domain-containing protein [Occallatibacter riparius]|uniref:Beta-lactamase family protein n=1 Tax=Occallatibacter riparius TaxID=1002689 RepID=A0A9J7BPB1_9BACT|nr:serine hydrolase domain-containing protein [Occallatibacter riparius]UWZ82973.1 beta-lactamase family protein [Occallatibacter riparius]